MATAYSGIHRHIAQELHISDDLVMERGVFGSIAIEQQEGVDEQRQIVDEGDIECPVLFERLRANAEEIRKIDAGLGSCTCAVCASVYTAVLSAESGEKTCASSAAKVASALAVDGWYWLLKSLWLIYGNRC